jgi:hypothetical protein
MHRSNAMHGLQWFTRSPRRRSRAASGKLDPKRLCCLQINAQLKLGGLHHRKADSTASEAARTVSAAARVSVAAPRVNIDVDAYLDADDQILPLRNDRSPPFQEALARSEASRHYALGPKRARLAAVRSPADQPHRYLATALNSRSAARPLAPGALSGRSRQ